MAFGVAARRRAPLVAAALVFAALTVMEQLGTRRIRRWSGPSSRPSSSPTRSAPTSRAAGWRSGVAWLVALVTVMSHPRSDVRRGLDLVWGWLVIVAAPVLGGPPAARPRAPGARAARRGQPRTTPSRGPSRRWPRSARGSPPSCTTSSPTRCGAWSSRPPARAAARRRASPRARARRSPPSSRPAARRWPRSGACSACCAARTRSWRSRRSRGSRHVADLVAARARQACR